MATRTATPKKTNAAAITKDYSRVNEIVAVVLLALSVLVFLSLISYNQTDYVPFITPDSKEVDNWIGVVGASISGILIDGIIGWTAYIIPALLALTAWHIFKTKTFLLRVSHIIGIFLFVSSLSGLFEVFGGQGAIVGEAIFQIFTYLFGTIGTGILLTVFFLTSILLITNLSIISFFSDFELAWQNFQMRFEDYFVGYKKWREARNQIALERLEKRRRVREVVTEPEIPAIAKGDEVSAEVEIKKESIGDKLSGIFARLSGSSQEPEKNQESVEAVSEPEIKIEEPEEFVPTIAIPEKKPEIIEKKKEEPKVEVTDLVAESEKIPITPVQATGDLDADLIEEFEDDEDEEIFEEPRKPQNYEDYKLPESEFLTPQPPRIEQKDEELLAIAQELTEKTKEFNVTGRVMHICQGPVVTTYEFKPDPGVKYSRVTGLVDDLCLALKAESIRIERIPGKAFVGIEVPNRERETIFLREVIESKKFQSSKSLLTLALGKTIDGLNYVSDLAKMPHLLIAGATGAGKSVGVNTLVVSILYKAKPDEVKFIMVDPKRLELGVYADIPHLATPIITDPKRAAISLKWAVSEMERRYKHLAGWGVRNIDGYNAEVKRRNAAGQLDEEGEAHKPLPYFVIIIDELADLMMTSGKEVESSITRLAQMARAVGIHLVLATQRPSVDVITGLIKANFPARISFRVSSKIDSRTIIDGNGAESLLGRGDMLFLPPATSQIIRVHGAFVDENEIRNIVEHIKKQGNPDYDETITKSEEEMDESGDLPGRNDPLFGDALQCVVGSKRASTSLLQRHLRIGYGRAAAILDALVAEGYIGEMDGSKRARPILQKAYEALQEAEEGREI
jgi:S-DNA-T family DNA segregation ATPase FtsK/SpoIIIE